MNQNLNTQVDLQTHFVITDLGVCGDRRKAYVFWGSDTDGRVRKIRELNLDQLGIEILDKTHLKPGTGLILYKGRIEQNHHPKD
jgi:hypothetical protein